MIGARWQGKITLANHGKRSDHFVLEARTAVEVFKGLEGALDAVGFHHLPADLAHGGALVWVAVLKVDITAIQAAPASISAR